MDRFSILKSIPLVVSPTGVKTGTYTTSYVLNIDAIKELPVLQLEDGAKGKRQLVTVGGQHCVHAVEKWVKTLHWQHSESVKERQHLQEQDSEGVTLEEIAKENHMQKLIWDSLQQMLDLGGQWMVVLYNAGEHLTAFLTY